MLPRHRIFLLLLAGLACAGISFTGEASRFGIDVLSPEVGAPQDPRNFKLALRLPRSILKSFPRMEPRNFTVHVFPEFLDDKAGLVDRYRARGIMLWQHAETVFLDVRLPPPQDLPGDYVVLVRCLVAGREVARSRAPAMVHYAATRVDVVLVIDSSMSMLRSDPQERRMAAARAFIDMASRGGNIRNVGIVSFNNFATILAPLTPTGHPEKLLNAMARVNARGQTNMDAALLAAARVLQNSDSGRKAIVFLTDGRNEPMRYGRTHRMFIKAKIPIFAIGLSDQADHELLARMARDTGGRSYNAASDMDLMAIYQRIASEIDRRVLLMSDRIQGSSSSLSLPVDGTIRGMSLVVGMEAATGKVALTDPAGKVLHPSENRGMAGSRHEGGSQILSVLRPLPGVWRMALSNPAIGRRPIVTVMVDSNLYLDLFPPQLVGRRLFLGATLACGERILPGARVRLLPNHDLVRPHELFDDGKHGDGRAGDGVFSGWIDLPPNLAGKLAVELRAWGRIGNQAFVRQAGRGVEGVAPMPVSPGPEMTARIIARDLDLGVALAGDQLRGRLRLTLVAEEPMRFKVGIQDLLSGTGGRIPGSGMRLQQAGEPLIRLGKSVLDVMLAIPPGTPPGSFCGRILLTSGKISASSKVKVSVVRAVLGLDHASIDLGGVRPGQELRRILKLGLDAPRGLPLSWKVMGSAGSLVRIERKPGQVLGVGPENPLPLNIRVPRSARPGPMSARIVLAAGPAGAAFSLRLRVLPLPEPEEEVPEAVYVIPLPEQPQPTPPARQVRMPPPPAEKHRPDTHMPPEPQEPPAAATADDALRQMRPFLLWVIVIAVLLLALLVILVREARKNRMLRYALGSLAVNCALLLLFVFILAPGAFVKAIQKPRLVAKLVGIKKDLGLSLSDSERRLLSRVRALDRKEQRFTEARKRIRHEKMDRPQAPVFLSKAKPTPELVSKRVPIRHKPRTSLLRKRRQRRTPVLEPEVMQARPRIQRKTELKHEEKPREATKVELAKTVEPLPKLRKKNAISKTVPTRAPSRKRIARLSRLQRPEPSLAFGPRRSMSRPRSKAVIEPRPEISPGLQPAAPRLVQPARKQTPRIAEIPEQGMLRKQDARAGTVTRRPVSLKPCLARLTTVRKSSTPRIPVATVSRKGAGGVQMLRRKQTGTRPRVAVLLPDTKPAALPAGGLPRQPAKSAARKESLPEAGPGELMAMVPGRDRSVPGNIRRVSLKTSPALARFNSGARSLPLVARISSPQRSLRPQPIRSRPRRAEIVRPEKPALPAKVVGHMKNTSPAPGRSGKPKSRSAAREEVIGVSARLLPKVGRSALSSIAGTGVRAQFPAPDVDLATGRVRPTLRVSGPTAHRRSVKPAGSPLPSVSADMPSGTTMVAKPARREIFRGDASGAVISGDTRGASVVPACRPPAVSLNPRPRAKFRHELPLSRMRGRLAPRTTTAPSRSNQGQGTARLNTSTEPGAISIVVGEVKFGSDWNSSPLAVANLVDAFRRRITAGVKIEKRTVELKPSDISGCQMLFMTGNLPFVFKEAEVRALRGYLAAGGLLWVNDSTREGDETFDRAWRSEVTRIIDTPLKRLPRTHALMRSGYDFSKGVAGYRVPPGDKYRVDYLEGVSLNGRLAILYTRNDYADGMALDPTLNPIRKSLTDLSAEEMQEISIRFGINVLAYALGGGSPSLQNADASLVPAGPALDPATLSLWQDFTGLTRETLGWEIESWGNPAKLSLAPDGAGGEALRVDLGRGNRDKVALKYDIPAKDGRRLDLSGVKSIVLDVYNGYRGGFRFALAVTTVGPGNDWRDFVSVSKYLRPGWNRNIRFKLKSAKFKSRESGWKRYDTPIRYPEACGKISFFFYNAGRIQTTVTLDNLRLERVPEKGRAP